MKFVFIGSVGFFLEKKIFHSPVAYWATIITNPMDMKVTKYKAHSQ